MRRELTARASDADAQRLAAKERREADAAAGRLAVRHAEDANVALRSETTAQLMAMQVAQNHVAQALRCFILKIQNSTRCLFLFGCCYWVACLWRVFLPACRRTTGAP